MGKRAGGAFSGFRPTELAREGRGFAERMRESPTVRHLKRKPRQRGFLDCLPFLGQRNNVREMGLSHADRPEMQARSLGQGARRRHVRVRTGFRPSRSKNRAFCACREGNGGRSNCGPHRRPGVLEDSIMRSGSNGLLPSGRSMQNAAKVESVPGYPARAPTGNVPAGIPPPRRALQRRLRRPRGASRGDGRAGAPARRGPSP